jgi:hypothetical protein
MMICKENITLNFTKHWLMIPVTIFMLQSCMVLPHPSPQVHLVSTDSGMFNPVMFDRSGEFLAAYDGWSQRVNVYRTEDLHLVTSHKLKGGQPYSLLFSPDARYLAIDVSNPWYWTRSGEER